MSDDSPLGEMLPHDCYDSLDVSFCVHTEIDSNTTPSAPNPADEEEALRDPEEHPAAADDPAATNVEFPCGTSLTKAPIVHTS